MPQRIQESDLQAIEEAVRRHPEAITTSVLAAVL